MKAKEFHKKLLLNRSTIDNLDQSHMTRICGGTLPTEMYCKPTDWDCPTDVKFC